MVVPIANFPLAPGEHNQYFVFAGSQAEYLRPELLNSDHGSGKQGYFPDALLE